MPRLAVMAARKTMKLPPTAHVLSVANCIEAGENDTRNTVQNRPLPSRLLVMILPATRMTSTVSSFRSRTNRP